MPDFGSATFSQTDASNNSGTMPSWSGSAAPSTLDDAGRALQGAVTREWNWRNYTLTSTGTGTALVLTYSVAPAAYYNGQRFAFITNTAVTGSCTLAINGLAATTIKKNLGGTLTNLASGDVPAGTYLEVEYNLAGTAFVIVNGILPFVSDSSGKIGLGTSSPSSYDGLASIFRAQTASNANLLTFVDGTSGGVLNIQAFNDGVAGSGFRQLYNAQFWSVGTGVPGAATERFRIDINGNALVTSSGGLGYGTGSGGTVTQITSKATGVTLNKTNGRIITTADALAALTAVQFAVTNSTVAATDTVLIQLASGDANTGLNYQVWVGNISGGSFVVTLLNRSGASRSEALTLNFSIIKAVTS